MARHSAIQSCVLWESTSFACFLFKLVTLLITKITLLFFNLTTVIMLRVPLYGHCLTSLFLKLKPLSLFTLPLYRSLFVHPCSCLVLYTSFLVVFLDSSVWSSMKCSKCKAKMSTYSNTPSSSLFMSVMAELMHSDKSAQWFWVITNSGVCIQISGLCGLDCRLLLFKLHLLSAKLCMYLQKKKTKEKKRKE